MQYASTIQPYFFILYWGDGVNMRNLLFLEQQTFLIQISKFWISQIKKFVSYLGTSA